jgi:sialic acid synthase SpsE
MNKLSERFGKMRGSERLSNPYVIAEAGVNHEGSMELAKRLIDEAKEGGADAVKFQSYKADTIASRDSPAYWDLKEEPTTSQHALFKKYDVFWKSEFEELRRYCDEVDIAFLSTPFDVESAEFLNDLVDVFKISSSDITNRPFIEFISSFGKPIVLSTGASELEEIVEAKGWIDQEGVPLALLHCVLSYPTADEDANLYRIWGLQDAFPGTMIGYSDHTLPREMDPLLLAAFLGAEILEKHFTHDKTLPGNDHYHAMDREDLKRFWRRWEELCVLRGRPDVCSIPAEGPAKLHARRSLVAKHLIPAGKTITREDLTWKRPAHGISPRQIDDVVGREPVRDIDEDERILWTILT